MTTADPARRRRLRWGALALFVAAPILCLGFAAANVFRAAEASDRRTAREATVAGLQARLASRNEGGGARVDMSPLYVEAASATLAVARLQQLVARAIERAPGRLIETRGGDEGDEGRAADADRTSIRLSATVDLTNEALLTLLHGIETGLPLLFVEQVAIRRAPGRAGSEEADPVLRVALVLRGHWRASTP